MSFLNSIISDEAKVTFSSFLKKEELSKLSEVVGDQRRAELVISFLYFKDLIDYDDFCELNMLIPSLFYSVNDYSRMIENTWDENQRKKEIDNLNKTIKRDQRLLSFFEISSEHLRFFSYEDFRPDYSRKLEREHKKYKNAEKNYFSHLSFEEESYNQEFYNNQKKLNQSSLLNEEQLEKNINFNRGENCIIFIYQDSKLFAIEHITKLNFLNKLKKFRNGNFLFKFLSLTPDISTDIYVDFLISNDLHEFSTIGTNQLNISSKKYILLETLKTYAKYKNYTSQSLNKYVKQYNIKIYHTKSNMKFVKFSNFINFFEGE